MRIFGGGERSSLLTFPTFHRNGHEQNHHRNFSPYDKCTRAYHNAADRPVPCLRRAFPRPYPVQYARRTTRGHRGLLHATGQQLDTACQQRRRNCLQAPLASLARRPAFNPQRPHHGIHCPPAVGLGCHGNGRRHVPLFRPSPRRVRRPAGSPTDPDQLGSPPGRHDLPGGHAAIGTYCDGALRPVSLVRTRVARNALGRMAMSGRCGTDQGPRGHRAALRSRSRILLAARTGFLARMLAVGSSGDSVAHATTPLVLGRLPRARGTTT